MKNPHEWKEKDFLLWLEENDTNLFTGSRTSQDRQMKWHRCFLESLENVISYCKYFLDNAAQTSTDDDISLHSYAKSVMNKAAKIW